MHELSSSYTPDLAPLGWSTNGVFYLPLPLVCPTVAMGKTLALPTKATDEMAQARRYDCAYSLDPSTMLILRNAKQHQIG